MKKYLFMLTAAALFAACSSEIDELANTGPSQAETGFTTGTDPVSFEAYAGKANTRATYGSINTDVLKTSSDGFGIFAFHAAGSTDYDGIKATTYPNFMYNQQVIYSGSEWTYDPIKYWPNETGTGATSTDAENLTFFAYAPHTKVTPSTGIAEGEPTVGIKSITSNSTFGDPIITFAVSQDPTKQVDLLWGVVPTSAGATWANVEGTGHENAIAAGLPWLNIQKPDTKASVPFFFKHALAKIRLNIDAYVDGDDISQPVAPKTRIYVREVKLTGGFMYEGKLNLNNTVADTPEWTKADGTPIADASENLIIGDGLQNNEEVGIYDGDVLLTTYVIKTVETIADLAGAGSGTTVDNHSFKIITTKEKYNYAASKWTKTVTSETTYAATGTAGTETTYWTNDACTAATTGGAAATFKNYVVDNEVAVFNGSIIQGGSGVTNNPVNLLKGGEGTCIMVIPTGNTFTGTNSVKIKYDVETTDANLAGSLTNPLYNGSVIENEIEKALGFSKFYAGKEYIINLHLGMTSVKVDVEVDDWTSGTDDDVDLPENTVAP